MFLLFSVWKCKLTGPPDECSLGHFLGLPNELNGRDKDKVLYYDWPTRSSKYILGREIRLTCKLG